MNNSNDEQRTDGNGTAQPEGATPTSAAPETDACRPGFFPTMSGGWKSSGG